MWELKLSKEEKKIAKLENEILKKKKDVVALKKKLPPVLVQDYIFKDFNNRDISLSNLFGNKNDLIFIHNMGRACPYCTLWADGFVGIKDHLVNRAGFVVGSPDKPDVQKKFYESRKWNFNMISFHSSSFSEDMGFKSEEEGFMPGVSSFFRNSKGEIFRVARSMFGPGDDFCSIWHLFDLLKEGVSNWNPRYNYVNKK